MQRYVFTAEGEALRLAEQARVWEPAAEALLDRIGVPAGARCVDLGCGPAGILAPLARRAGPQGLVIGVDRAAAHVAAAREHARAAGLATVEIVEDDAYATRLPRGAFDLVHARFVIAPLGRGEALVREMIALARPGGVIALQEPDHSAFAYLPPTRAWARIKRMLDKAFPLFGGDAYAGQRVFGLLRRMGLEDVQVSAAALALHGRHPYMRTPLHGLAAARRFILDAGIATEAEIDEAAAELSALIEDPDTHCTMFNLVQAWGCRPERP
jgi:SAM-dependent methyltransferase